MTGTSIWHSNKHGDCEIDAEVVSRIMDEDGDIHVKFKWVCPQLGWGEYEMTLYNDGSITIEDEHMDRENLPFLGAILQSVVNKGRPWERH